LIGGIITILLTFYGLKYAVGMIAGLSFAEIHRRVKANYISNMLFFRNRSSLSSYSFFTFGIVFLCIPMLLGVLYPDRINIMTAALGILLFKYEVFASEVFFGRREKRDDS
jgi:hypothetical protein